MAKDDFQKALENSINKINTIDLPSLDNLTVETILLINDKLNKSDKIVREFANFHYQGQDSLSKISEIAEYHDLFRSKLVSENRNKSSELETLVDKIHENKNNEGMLRKLREKANAVDDYLTLGVRKILEMPKTIYNRKRNKIDKIQSSLDEVLERYQNFDTAINIVKELKNIKSKISGGLIQSRVLEECDETDYYEGKIFIKKLTEEINSIIKNPTVEIAKRNKIKEEIKYLNNLLRITNKEGVDYSKNELNELKEFISSGIKKFENNYFSSKEINKYNNLANNLYEHSKKIIITEQESAKKKLEDLKRIRESIEAEVSSKKYKELREGVESLNLELSNGMREINYNVKEGFEKINSNTKKINLVSNETKYTSNRLNDLSDKFNGFRQKVDEIENKTKSTYNLVQEIKESNETLFESIKNIVQTREENQNKTDKQADNNVSKNLEFKESLYNCLSEISKDLYGLKEKFENLEIQDKDLETEVEDVKERMDDIKNNTDAYKSGKIFSLPLYMHSIAYPENIRLYTARRILSGDNGEKDWSERFENFRNEIKGFLIKGQNDYEYFGKIKVGLQKAINSPGPFFDVNTAKESYNLVDEKIKSFAA